MSEVRCTSRASARPGSSQVSLAVGVPRTWMDPGNVPSDTNALSQGSSKLVTHWFTRLYRTSLWYLELIPHKGRAVGFATSASGDRKTMFERSAAVAKAASLIASVLVQVFVAGNVWTAGWPPKKKVTTP
jgi:hypothetical protein